MFICFFIWAFSFHCHLGTQNNLQAQRTGNGRYKSVPCILLTQPSYDQQKFVYKFLGMISYLKPNCRPKPQLLHRKIQFPNWQNLPESEEISFGSGLWIPLKPQKVYTKKEHTNKFHLLQIDSAPDDHNSIRNKNTEFSNTESEIVAYPVLYFPLAALLP
jgi:hypothetical protein